jgi:hypothetical protein
MKQFRILIAAVMLAALFLGSSAARSRYTSDVLNLYAYNGTSYTELVSSGGLDDGYTTTAPETGGHAWPATITNASGVPRLLMTKIGSSYDTLYATTTW